MFLAAVSLRLVYHFSHTWIFGCQGCTDLQSYESCFIPVCSFLQTVHGRGCQTRRIQERTTFILRRYKTCPHQANSSNFTVQYFSTHHQTQQQPCVELNNHFHCSTPVCEGTEGNRLALVVLVLNCKINFSEIAFLLFIYIHENGIWFSKLNSTFHLQITALDKEWCTSQFALYKWEAGQVPWEKRWMRESLRSQKVFPWKVKISKRSPPEPLTHSCSGCSPDCSHSRV